MDLSLIWIRIEFKSWKNHFFFSFLPIPKDNIHSWNSSWNVDWFQKPTRRCVRMDRLLLVTISVMAKSLFFFEKLRIQRTSDQSNPIHEIPFLSTCPTIRYIRNLEFLSLSKWFDRSWANHGFQHRYSFSKGLLIATDSLLTFYPSFIQLSSIVSEMGWRSGSFDVGPIHESLIQFLYFQIRFGADLALCRRDSFQIRFWTCGCKLLAWKLIRRLKDWD